jgi:hypothetical protein
MLKYLVFIFYRLFEKLTNKRLEGTIGSTLFLLHRKMFLGVHDSIIQPSDKRKMWEGFRLVSKHKTIKNLELDLECQMFNAVENGQIAFENSMETSIRGINLIYTLSKRMSFDNFPLKYKVFLAFCFIHVCFCPDLYLKRRRFKITDESNNHRFYNLIFFQYYNIYRGKKCNFSQIEKFIFSRLVDKSFYDEGSSYYHYGVVDTVRKLTFFASEYSKYTNLTSELIDWVSALERFQNVFEKINFGDRDGTIIEGKSGGSGVFKGDTHTKILNTKKFFLKENHAQVFFIRKENWTNIGTNGHVHDDAGHVVLLSSLCGIVDPGTYLYEQEPKLSKYHYHNFPVVNNTASLFFKNKFQREVKTNLEIDEDGKIIKITRYFNDYKVTRSFSKISGTFIDTIATFDDFVGTARATFFSNFSKKNIFISKNESCEKILKIGSKITLRVGVSCSFMISSENIFPDYAQASYGSKIEIFTKSELLPNSEYEILVGNFSDEGFDK